MITLAALLTSIFALSPSSDNKHDQTALLIVYSAMSNGAAFFLLALSEGIRKHYRFAELSQGTERVHIRRACVYIVGALAWASAFLQLLPLFLIARSLSLFSLVVANVATFGLVILVMIGILVISLITFAVDGTVSLGGLWAWVVQHRVDGGSE